MTFLGKIFVMINVAVSLLMAFLAFGLYTNSVDWGYDVTKPGQEGGLIKEKKDQIKDMLSTQGPVESAYRKARETLATAEELRSKDRAFFAKMLDDARNAKEGIAVRVVETTKSLATRDKEGFKMKDARTRDDASDLYARTYYEKQYADSQAENLRLLERLELETRKDIVWTLKMTDVAKPEERNPYRDAKPAFVEDPKEATLEPLGLRGLRTLLTDERKKREDLDEEFVLLKPLVNNARSENDLVQVRLKALRERIAELDAYIAKRKMDVGLTRR